MIDLAAQIIIVTLGPVAIILAASKVSSKRRLAGYIGLTSEIGWLATSIIHHQWSIFILVFVYSYGFTKMITNNREEN